MKNCNSSKIKKKKKPLTSYSYPCLIIEKTSHIHWIHNGSSQTQIYVSTRFLFKVVFCTNQSPSGKFSSNSLHCIDPRGMDHMPNECCYKHILRGAPLSYNPSRAQPNQQEGGKKKKWKESSGSAAKSFPWDRFLGGLQSAAAKTPPLVLAVAGLSWGWWTACRSLSCCPCPANDDRL